jgi:hypothetical protein
MITTEQLHLSPTLQIKLQETGCCAVKIAVIISGVLQLVQLGLLPIEPPVSTVIFVGLRLLSRNNVTSALALTDLSE